jgi:hypothetical protein
VQDAPNGAATDRFAQSVAARCVKSDND